MRGAGRAVFAATLLLLVGTINIIYGIGEKMDAALPPGSGGVIAVYDSDGAAAVDDALANAVKKSIGHIDGMKAKELKAGLEEAQAGMSG